MDIIAVDFQAKKIQCKMTHEETLDKQMLKELYYKLVDCDAWAREFLDQGKAYEFSAQLQKALDVVEIDRLGVPC